MCWTRISKGVFWNAITTCRSINGNTPRRLDEQGARRHEDAAYRAAIGEAILLKKNYEALGSFRREDRPAALDRLGFASQLVFTTFCLGNFGLDQSGDMELCYAAADAHNRMMTDFCSIDRRLLAVAYVPLEDFARAEATTRLAIKLGAKAIMVPSVCPQKHSPSHIGLDPVWRLAEEAGLPILLHVGGEEKLNPVYKANGLPPVKDFHGGVGNFTSVSYMPIPQSAMQTLATLIFDGVFDRFPKLKWGAIELGAAWVPDGCARWIAPPTLSCATRNACRNSPPALRNRPPVFPRRALSARRHGWIIRNAGDEICLFSSDYPHVEGVATRSSASTKRWPAAPPPRSQASTRKTS